MDAGTTRQVICINWGTKYGADYVNRLAAMVSRNITPPFTFTCFTDSAEGFDPGIRIEDLPPISYDLPTGTKGIWPKSRLWGARLGSLTGPVLFLDLDVIVKASLDPFFDYADPSDVVMTPNRGTPFETLGQTSVYRFEVGSLKPMQDLFAADPQGFAEAFRYEQRFVTKHAPGGPKFFPAHWTAHFRRDCRRTFPLNYLLPPKEPRDAKIVIFPGSLNPDHAIRGQYGSHTRPRRARDHLAALFTGDRVEKPLPHLRHFIRPTPWVAKYWRL